jgi:ribonuclease HI
MQPELEELFAQLERSLLAPEVRRCPRRAGALLDPEFVEIGSSGCVYTRDQVLEGMLREEPRDQRIEALVCRVLSTTLVLTTYRLIRRGHVHSQRSSIWRLVDGDWRMYFHQGTLITGGAAEAGEEPAQPG